MVGKSLKMNIKEAKNNTVIIIRESVEILFTGMVDNPRLSDPEKRTLNEIVTVVEKVIEKRGELSIDGFENAEDLKKQRMEHQQ